jgi:hypothetical protein
MKVNLWAALVPALVIGGLLGFGVSLLKFMPPPCTTCPIDCSKPYAEVTIPAGMTTGAIDDVIVCTTQKVRWIEVGTLPIAVHFHDKTCFNSQDLNSTPPIANPTTVETPTTPNPPSSSSPLVCTYTFALKDAATGTIVSNFAPAHIIIIK